MITILSENGRRKRTSDCHPPPPAMPLGHPVLALNERALQAQEDDHDGRGHHDGTGAGEAQSRLKRLVKL